VVSQVPSGGAVASLPLRDRHQAVMGGDIPSWANLVRTRWRG